MVEPEAAAVDPNRGSALPGSPGARPPDALCAIQPGRASDALTAIGVDRRGFLRGVTGAAAVACASLVPAGCSADYPQAAADETDLRSLSPKEYAVVRAAAEALLAGVAVEPAQIAAAIDRELAAVGDPIESDLRNVLRLIEHFTILSWHRRTFTELDPSARRSYLKAWSTSRFAIRRGAYQALRGFVVYFAYIRPETRTLTGFEGPLIERIPATLVRTVDFGEIA